MTAATFRALGSLAVVAVTDDRALSRALAVTGLECAAAEAVCSRFRPSSELSRLNDRAGEAVPVGPQLLAAIGEALRAAELTGGLVDPTLGRQLMAAGYHRDFAEVAASPVAPAVRIVLERAGTWRDVRLDQAAGTVAVPAGISLDLGATAKAATADRAAARVAACCPGVGVLVSLGGDVAVAGPPPASGWAVRIEDSSLTDPGRGGGPVIAVHDGGLATSGTAVRRWAGGHHLIDPVSGHPADSPWRTVSVAAASALDANIASTAAVLLGAQAPAWLAAAGLPARLVRSDGTAEVCAGWPEEPVRTAA